MCHPAGRHRTARIAQALRYTGQPRLFFRRTMAPGEKTRTGKLEPADRQRRPRAGRRLLPYLLALGPGLLAASAGNDAGGIATYASAGASYGYGLLWAMVVV